MLLEGQGIECKTIGALAFEPLRGPSVGAEDCWGALEAYAKGADGYVEGIDGCAEGIDGCTEGIDGCIEGAEGAMGCVVKLVRAGVNLTVEDMDKI